MKKEKSQQILQKYQKKKKKTHKGILWISICQQIWQPRRNGQLSRNIQPTKMNQEEKLILTDHLEWNWVYNKNIPYKQSRSKWLYRWILPDIQRRTYTHPSQTFPNSWRRRNTSKDVSSHHHPNTKTRQRYYQKRKL